MITSTIVIIIYMLLKASKQHTLFMNIFAHVYDNSPVLVLLLYLTDQKTEAPRTDPPNNRKLVHLEVAIHTEGSVTPELS